MADTSVVDEQEEQEGPPPGAIIKPIEAQDDSEGPPPGAVIKPIGDAAPAPQQSTPESFPQGTVQAHDPTLGEQLRGAISNTAIGHAVQSTMPKVASALGITPTESDTSPDYQQHKQQLISPEYVAPALSAVDTAVGLKNPEQKKNIVIGATKGLGGLTSAQSMALLAGTGAGAAAVAGLVNPASAAVLSRLVSGGFTFDMLHSLYQQNKEYKKAVDSGNVSQAQQIQGEMGLTGVMALMTGAHSLHGVAGRPTASEADLTKEAVQEADKVNPEKPKAPAKTSAKAEEPEGPPPGSVIKPIEDNNRSITQAATADTMAERRSKKSPLAPIAAEATNELQPVGEKHEETGRDILQPTDNPVTLDAAAKAAAPKLEDGLEDAVKGIPGARLDAVRASKKPARLAEKIEDEGQPAETIPDYLASRVIVDSPEAKDAAVKAIKKQFTTVRDEDKFDDGDKDYGYRRHALQVTMPSGLTAEVHIVPREVAAINADEHENYKEARDAEAAGDEEKFKAAAAEAKAKNDEAMARFNERNGIVADTSKTPTAKGGRGESPEQSAEASTRVEASAPKIGSGSYVLLPDGTTGRVDYYNEAMGRARVTTADGKRLPSVKSTDMTPVQPVKVTRKTTNTPREAEIAKRVEAGGAKYVADYIKDNTVNGTLYLGTDAAKALIPEYKANPTESNGDVNSSASAIMEAAWKTATAKKPEPGKEFVQIVVGAPATGKTSGALGGEPDPRIGIIREAIPLDDKYALQMINESFASGRKPVVEMIYTDDPKENVRRMVGRAKKIGRPVSTDFMARAYTAVPKVIAEMQKRYGSKLPVTSIDNSGKPGTEKVYSGTAQPAVDATGKYTYKSAKEAMDEELERLYKAGEVPENIYREALRPAFSNTPGGPGVRAEDSKEPVSSGKERPSDKLVEEKPDADRERSVKPAAAEADKGGEKDAVREQSAAGVLPRTSREGREERGSGVRRSEQRAEEPAGTRIEQEEQRGRPAAKADEKEEVAKEILTPGSIPEGWTVVEGKPAAKTSSAFFKREEAPTWYLKSQKLIDQKMKGPMTGDQLLRMLENGGVKADELKWTGLGDFLKGKFRVTPEQVHQHLAEGGIQVKEVVKGQGGMVFRTPFSTEAKLKEAISSDEMLVKDDGVTLRKGLSIVRDGEGWNIHDTTDKGDSVKYASYQLPGGENYREMLLTLPEGPKREFRKEIKYDANNDWILKDGPETVGTYQTSTEAEFAAKKMWGEDWRRVNAEVKPDTNFRSGHWDEPNILAHVRMNDRVTPEGKRLLHIEEIQSDWHQKGRDKGYKPPPDELAKAEATRLRLEAIGRDATPEQKQEWADAMNILKPYGDPRVPDAPFKKDWHEMAFRRMVRLAAEKGYDGVSWTPGEKQAERYDLSKQIDRLYVLEGNYEGFPGDGKGYEVKAFKGGYPAIEKRVPPNELPDLIGKDMARKVLENIEENKKRPVPKYSTDLNGLDLKVGGEGMKGFYDKIIPDYARKFGKQWGAKVGETRINGNAGTESRFNIFRPGSSESYAGPFVTEAEAARYKDSPEDEIRQSGGTDVPYLNITPDMRKAVTTEGVALFKRGEGLDEKGTGRFYSVPAMGDNAPMVNIDRTVRDAINALVPDMNDAGNWAAVSMPEGEADRLAELLRLKDTPLSKRLADTIDKARDEQGNVILLTQSDAMTVAEEQFHSYQHRQGTMLGDVTFQISNSPEVLKSQKYLKKLGYSDSLEEAAHEATAKTFAGDWEGAGLTRDEGAALLHEFLDAIVKVRGKRALIDIPNISDEIADVIGEAYERNQVPKRERGRATPNEEQKGVERKGEEGGRGLRDSEARGPSGGNLTGTQGRLFTRGADGKVRFKKVEAQAEEKEEQDKPLPLTNLMDEAAKLDTKKLTLAQRIEKSAENSIGHIAKDSSAVMTALAKAKGEIAGLWDAYRRPPQWTDFKDMLGQFTGAMQAEHWRLAKFADELKRVVPDKERRVAMTNWVEANGDKALLEQRARASKTPELKASYELATKLTPEEVQIARAGKEYFRQMFEAGKAANLLDQAAGDYIMHIHEPDSKAAEQMRSLINFSELNPNPSIIKERVFRSYFDAEQAGEKAKDKDFGFLTAAYQDTFARAIHSRAFIRSLLEGRAADGRPLATLGGMGKWAQIDPTDEPYVLTQPKRPERLAHSIIDYRYLDHPALRNWLWELTDEDAAAINPKLFEDAKKALAIRGDLMLHPEIFDHVNKVLSRSAVRKYWLGRAALATSNTLKQSLLSFSGFHQTQETVHGLEHLVNPMKLKDLDLGDKTQRALVDHGLMVADFDAESAMSEGISSSALKYVPVIGDAMASYQHYLFHDYIPRMKMTMALHALERNRVRFKGKMDEDQILEMTAKQSNAAFGGQNYKMMGRNPTAQDIIRLLALAPDFLESRAKFVAQAFKPYGTEQRVALIRGALVMYAGARILNAILNDGDAKWDEQDAFKIVDHGRRYGLRTVQGDLLNLVASPRLFLEHRLNPMTTRPLVEFLTARDEFGRQKGAVSQAKDYAKSVVPIPFQNRMKQAETDWLESILNAAGAETGKYRTPAEDMAHKLHMQNIPDKPEDPDAEKVEESRTKYQFVEKLRSGKATTTDLWNAVNDGKLTAAQAKRAQEESELTPLQVDLKAIGLEQALKVYEKASPAERADIEPIIQQKRQRWEADHEVTPKEREKLESKLEELNF